MKIKLTWSQSHSHDDGPEFLESLPLSAQVRECVRKYADVGYRWEQFRDVKARMHHENSSTDPNIEALKIKPYHFDYQRRKKDSSQDVGNSVLSKLRAWAELIRTQSGVAAVTDKFASLYGSSILHELKTVEGRKVWSFIMSTAWQQKTFKLEEKVFHLVANRNICKGAVGEENAQMYTIVVKNQYTGQGTPVAFMLTNSGCDSVIANFLKEATKHANVRPGLVILDCNPDEVNAVQSVWGMNVPIAFCKSHILRAFEQTLPEKIQTGERSPNFLASTSKQILDNFTRILNSLSIAEVDKTILDFMKKYSKFPALMKYMHEQWLPLRSYVLKGWRYMEAETEEKIYMLDSFHCAFERYEINDDSKQQADDIVKSLFETIEPRYRAMSLRRQRGCTDSAISERGKSFQQEVHDLSEDKIGDLIAEKGTGKYLVRPLNEGPTHLVDLGIASATPNGGSQNTHPDSSCTCSIYLHGLLKCKHIFLVERLRQMSLERRLGDQNRNAQSSSTEANEFESSGVCSASIEHTKTSRDCARDIYSKQTSEENKFAEKSSSSEYWSSFDVASL